METKSETNTFHWFINIIFNKKSYFIFEYTSIVILESLSHFYFKVYFDNFIFTAELFVYVLYQTKMNRSIDFIFSSFQRMLFQFIVKQYLNIDSMYFSSTRTDCASNSMIFSQTGFVNLLGTS